MRSKSWRITDQTKREGIDDSLTVFQAGNADRVFITEALAKHRHHLEVTSREGYHVATTYSQHEAHIIRMYEDDVPWMKRITHFAPASPIQWSFTSSDTTSVLRGSPG
jgi:hypothetical protein